MRQAVSVAAFPCCRSTNRDEVPVAKRDGKLQTVRYDAVNASVEAGGDNARMETHKFDAHTHRLNVDSVPFKVR